MLRQRDALGHEQPKPRTRRNVPQKDTAKWKVAKKPPTEEEVGGVMGDVLKTSILYDTLQ